MDKGISESRAAVSKIEQIFVSDAMSSNDALNEPSAAIRQRHPHAVPSGSCV